MKKILLFICLSIFSVKIYSQAVNLGFRGGLSIPNIIAGGGNPLSEGYSSRLAGSGGIFTEIRLNGTYSLRFGVEYTGQGGKRNGIQAMSSNQMITDIATRMGAGITEDIAATLGQMAQYMPPVFYADVKNLAKFDYVMIPVSLQAGKNLGNSSYRIYANAGPFVSFLMSGEQVSKGASKIYSDAAKTQTLWEIIPTETQTLINNTVPELAGILEAETEFGASVITGELRPANFGVQGNLGLSYQYNKRNRFFVEVGGNYGFIRIQKNKSNGSNYIGSANIMIGYSFEII